MTKTDKEALAFGLTLLAILIGGTTVIAVKEHQRNTACAELGGIIVDLKCGRFEAIEGYQQP